MSNMKTCLMCGESAKPIESRATPFCSERCHRHWKTCGAALWNEAMWRVQATELCDECEDQRSANNNNKEQSMSEMKAVSPFGNEVPCVETWDDHLWALCDEFGPRVFVTADTFENAWEEAVDALPAIPADEVHEAYGFDTDEELAAAASKADRRENESPGTYGEQRGEDQTPSLAEGYEYQSNATGTGIVWVGYHATLVCPTSDMLPEQWRGTKLSVTIADRVFTVECEEVE